MRFIHALSAAACAALFVGCGPGEEGNGGSGASAGTAGAAGTAGTAGASGTAGSSSGTSGTSGMSGSAGTAGTTATGGGAGTAGTAGTSGTGGAAGTAGTAGTDGGSGTAGASGTAGTDGAGGSAGTDASGGSAGSSGSAGTAGTGSGDCTDTGAAETMSFFLTSWHHIQELSGSEDGFGGDLRYNGAATGLEGADAICQEIARRVCFGHRTWRAYLSTSTVNAIDRIGPGPWYDYAGLLVSNDIAGLLSGDRPAGGASNEGTYDETGIFHDGETDVNNDGIDDDDHDTMTATTKEGTYSGFSCDDWTSTTATDMSGGQGQGGGPGGFPGGGFNSGIMMGHAWPAQSGRHWATSHSGHQCAAGTNFIQDGPGNGATVGGGGGYGGFYCFALPQ